MFDPNPYYNVCIAKIYQTKPIKRTFVQVGVGWLKDDGSVMFKIDISVILTPEDEVYLFLKNKP